ncbi:MAG: hypothetical protein D6768_15030 [Chloroflexi bacterium]|nr:MAG: hypothetical protein D6768_15030 [Chloroflexota bacterium]
MFVCGKLPAVLESGPMNNQTSPRPRRTSIRLWRKNKSFIYNLHPPRIPAAGARFSYTLGMGGLAVLATVITILSGVLLMFYYVPTVEQAHPSLTYIDSVVAFGRLLRSLHFWAGQMLLLVALVHVARIVFTGGYRPPRDFNWLIGLGLLVILLLWNFTGYTLRWDADSIWALLVGTNLLKVVPQIGDRLYKIVVGDVTLGAAALLRFYAWHIFGLTLFGVTGIGYHIWRIRVDGGISHPVPQPGQPREYISRETLFFREIITALVATAGLLVLAALAPPALGPQADLSAAGVSEVKAPWFFLAVQEMLRVISPLWAGWLIPLGALILLALIPLLDRRGPGRGRWFARERWQVQALFGVIALAALALTVVGALR